MRKITVKVLLLMLTLAIPLAMPLAIHFAAQSSHAFQCHYHAIKGPLLKEGLILPPSDLGTAPKHPAAPALNIGFQRSFFAIDFARKQQYSISATLRASGTHSYINPFKERLIQRHPQTHGAVYTTF